MTILSRIVTSLTALFATAAPVGDAPPAPASVAAWEQPDDEHQRGDTRIAELAAPSAPAVDVDVVVAKLQKTYESTTDFSARFTQRYTLMALKKSQESTGTVVFKKPGRMRWDYETPAKKSFVVASGKLHVVQPADNTALVDHCFKEDGLTASVSFLWGSGNIKDEFDVTHFPGTFGEKTDHHLSLVPKKKNSVFARLILVVDPASSRVTQSVVVDPQGNVNQFMFSDARFNSGVDDARFVVEIPAGMAVSRMPGSCDPATKR